MSLQQVYIWTQQIIKVSQNVFEMPTEISLTELKGYEEITPPYTIRPKIVHLQYNSKQKYRLVIFDA